MPFLFSERVLLGEEKLQLTSATLRIAGGEIAEVRVGSREEARTRASEAGETWIDVGDRVITPAFVNAHTHLSLGCLRGLGGADPGQGNVVEDFYYPVENSVLPEDVEAFTKIGAYESLLSGVGCVWDHYYHADAVVRALVETGLSGVVCPTLQDVTGPGKDSWEAQLETTLSIHGDAALREQGVVAALGPHATDTVSSALWQRCAELAEAEGLWMHCHVSQSIEEFQRSVDQHGCAPIARLHSEDVLGAGAGVLLVHGLFVSDAELQLLDPARHVLGYCPFSQLQFGFPAHLQSWRQAGIPFVVATDCGACNDTWNVQAELRLVAGGASFFVTGSEEFSRYRISGDLAAAQAVAARRESVVNERADLASPEALLRTVFSGPGGMHSGLPLGAIRSGARANLVIWESDHPAFWPPTNFLRSLSMADVSGAIHGMMVSGRWIGERGHFSESVRQSEGYRAAHEEADARLVALLSRAGL